MAKRGPKTEAGKASVRLNAVRHGVLSTTPVIPGVERQEDWETLLAGVMTSLAPTGQLETALAERVALTLWRLMRVTRYETEIIAADQEPAENDLAETGRFRTLGPGSAQLQRVAAELSRMRPARLLPIDPILLKVIRYESHLNRQLYQALHELEALQGRRQGEPTPLARLDVQGLAEG